MNTETTVAAEDEPEAGFCTHLSVSSEPITQSRLNCSYRYDRRLTEKSMWSSEPANIGSPNVSVIIIAFLIFLLFLSSICCYVVSSNEVSRTEVVIFLQITSTLLKWFNFFGSISQNVVLAVI